MRTEGLACALLMLALIGCVPGGWIVLGLLLLWGVCSPRGGQRARRRRGSGAAGGPT